jgi:hypothetical protein
MAFLVIGFYLLPSRHKRVLIDHFTRIIASLTPTSFSEIAVSLLNPSII